jgi:predicted PurR-regulated permease PerM
MTYPTPWQRKTIWSALTALSIVAIGAIAIGIIWLATRAVSFLQPILIPFAVAGVLAYLLDPLVERLMRTGMTRQRAVVCVFAIVLIFCAALGLWVGPALARETTTLVRRVPKYAVDAKNLGVRFAKEMQQRYHIRILPSAAPTPKPTPEPGATPKPAVTEPAATEKATPTPGASRDHSAVKTPPAEESEPATSDSAEPDLIAQFDKDYDLQELFSGDFGGWLAKELPVLFRNTWRFLITSVGGFLGIFGFLLSFVIVPLYLFYFLTESAHISRTWSDYLPLRASWFKDEVVGTITEINGYLMAFFRGQLLVSLINGTATGIGLVIVGLDFGLLIGLMQCVLGLIPYLGFIMCWIPAVIIAAVQGGSWLIPSSPWWLMPLVVTTIFFCVQQFDSWFVTPKIVGESVGLHPLTVIFSVLLWSLMLGGLLGAILAVPLTATLKVLLKRYVWQRTFPARAEETTEVIASTVIVEVSE